MWVKVQIFLKIAYDDTNVKAAIYTILNYADVLSYKKKKKVGNCLENFYEDIYSVCQECIAG